MQYAVALHEFVPMRPVVGLLLQGISFDANGSLAFGQQIALYRCRKSHCDVGVDIMPPRLADTLY
jgi:hypothetical protein